MDEENGIRLKPESLADLWGAGFVNRWHTHPHPGLRNAQDTTGAHAWRVAILATMISADNPEVNLPTVISDVMAALFHDAPERATGDLAYPFKKANPDVVQRLETYEHEWLSERGVPKFQFSPMVKLCDRLDAYLFMLVHAPDLMHNPEWAKHRREMVRDAVEQNCGGIVARLIENVEARGWY
jgi:hypothetical protein